MNNNSNIPYEELKLPTTGSSVRISKYLTTGQSRELQKIMLSSGDFDVDQAKLSNIKPDVILTMQEKAAEHLIQGYTDAENNFQSFTRQWLDDLPIKDGNMVYEKVNQITAEANLGDEERKKS